MKNKYRIDLKFFGIGASDPILIGLRVTHELNNRDEPTGYGWIIFEGAEEEFNELYAKLEHNEKNFKIIGFDKV